MATEIRVPTLGESVSEATVGKWLKQAGEAVGADEPLVELETDKVAVEVPAPASGTIADIVAKEGDTLAVGGLAGAFHRRRRACGKAGAGAKACGPASAGRRTRRPNLRSKRRCRLAGGREDRRRARLSMWRQSQVRASAARC